LRNYARANYGVEMEPEEAQLYRHRFFETYPGIKRWHNRERQEWQSGNTETRTLTGRRRTDVHRFTERLNSPCRAPEQTVSSLPSHSCTSGNTSAPARSPFSRYTTIVVESDENNVDKVKVWLEGDDRRDG
jgi:DNA polymerase-1